MHAAPAARGGVRRGAAGLPGRHRAGRRDAPDGGARRRAAAGRRSPTAAGGRPRPGPSGRVAHRGTDPRARRLHVRQPAGGRSAGAPARLRPVRSGGSRRGHREVPGRPAVVDLGGRTCGGPAARCLPLRVRRSAARPRRPGTGVRRAVARARARPRGPGPGPGRGGRGPRRGRGRRGHARRGVVLVTVPAVLDPTHRLDPALPGLPAVLSAHPPGTAADARCRVRSVDWVPRRRCRVVQEVRGPEGRTLLAYEVTPSGTTVSRPADDPPLPGLPVALSGTRVRSRLAELCRAPVTGCRVTPVAHRPGSRAVVSYDVVAGGGRARFYAKLLAEGSDRYAAAATAIAEAARHRQTRVPVPEVVACWPDLGAVVSRAAPGRTLSDLLRDETLPEPAALRHAERLGRLLAGVH